MRALYKKRVRHETRVAVFYVGEFICFHFSVDYFDEVEEEEFFAAKEKMMKNSMVWTKFAYAVVPRKKRI